MKQTAVEWLVDKFSTQGTLHSSDISQAKEMEREQIMDAYSAGADDEYEHHVNLSVKREDIDCEKYYNETYGK